MGAWFLCQWGSAKKNDVGQSDKTSKLIMAITVTCKRAKITNFECMCWTFICFKRKSCELVPFCHSFFCLNMESALTTLYTYSWFKQKNDLVIHSSSTLVFIQISTLVWIYTASLQFDVLRYEVSGEKPTFTWLCSLSPTASAPWWLCNVGARCHLLLGGGQR